MSLKDMAVFALLSLSLPLALHGQMQSHKQVTPSVRPPASVQPVTATRQSTALAAAARINPERPKELPGLALVNADGKSIDTYTFVQKAHWLLLYRQAACIACDRLMASMAQAASFQHGASIAVVVEAAAPAALATVRTQFPEWSSATWAAAPQGTAAKALKARGTPMLYGMDGATIVFAQAGTPGGPEQASSAALAWAAMKKSAGTSEEKQ